MKDNTKKLYESIMASVAKEVKKAINEGEYNEDGIDIQSDTEKWESAVKEYLWDHVTGIQANADKTLGLFATLVYLDQLDDEEIKEIAERIMEEVDAADSYDNPLIDEVFIEAVAETLKDNASDWCADVIRDWKLNQ